MTPKQRELLLLLAQRLEEGDYEAMNRTAILDAALLRAVVEEPQRQPLTDEQIDAVLQAVAEKHLISGRYCSVIADHSTRAGGQVDGAEECAAAIRAMPAQPPSPDPEAPSQDR